MADPTDYKLRYGKAASSEAERKHQYFKLGLDCDVDFSWASASSQQLIFL